MSEERRPLYFIQAGTHQRTKAAIRSLRPNDSAIFLMTGLGFLGDRVYISEAMSGAENFGNVFEEVVAERNKSDLGLNLKTLPEEVEIFQSPQGVERVTNFAGARGILKTIFEERMPTDLFLPIESLYSPSYTYLLNAITKNVRAEYGQDEFKPLVIPHKPSLKTKIDEAILNFAIARDETLSVTFDWDDSVRRYTQKINEAAKHSDEFKPFSELWTHFKASRVNPLYPTLLGIVQSRNKDN